jgi:pseudomonalisin
MYDKLAANEVLEVGQELVPPDSRYALKMQSDGNLVLYRQGKILWASTTQQSGAVRLVMRGDGNLVLLTGASDVVWNSETAGNDGASMQIQNDGNLVIYSRNAEPIWATGAMDSVVGDKLAAGEALEAGQELRSPGAVTGGYRSSYGYTLKMQTDGDLVLYSNYFRQPVWATNTNGTGAIRAVMQEDGNLVLYTGAGVPVWASNTAGENGSLLQLQSDGNLVIYSGQTSVWATGVPTIVR